MQVAFSWTYTDSDQLGYKLYYKRNHQSHQTILSNSSLKTQSLLFKLQSYIVFQSLSLFNFYSFNISNLEYVKNIDSNIFHLSNCFPSTTSHKSWSHCFTLLLHSAS